METTLVVFFEKIIVYMPGKFWYGEFLVHSFVHLRPVWEFWAMTSQTPLWIFLIFVWMLFLWSSLKKIIFCMPGKFKDVQNLDIFDQILGYLWIFSLSLPKIVAVLWILTLSGEPIVLCLVKLFLGFIY